MANGAHKGKTGAKVLPAALSGDITQFGDSPARVPLAWV